MSPVVDGRLRCCTCGEDLGDAEDPYRDPGCRNCINREALADAEAEDGLELMAEDDELANMTPEEIAYLDQREAMIDAERSAYYGDLGIGRDT